MLSSVFAKSVRDQRWALLGWSIGVVLLVVVQAAVWPTMRDLPAFEEMLAGYPEALRDLFDLGAMATGVGFFNVELFSLVLPILFVVFAVGRGARLVAGEEEQGSLDVVLVTPVSTTSLLLQKAAALAVGVAVLAVVVFVTVLVCVPVFDLGFGVGELAPGVLAMWLLGTELGCVALAVGAVTGRRHIALAVAGAVAVVSYVLYALGQIVEAIQPWQQLSPVHQAVSEGPLGGGVPASFGWLVLVTVLVVVAALPAFDRRDVRTA